MNNKTITKLIILITFLPSFTLSNLLSTINRLSHKNGLRKMVGEPSEFLQQINGYGCWCYFDERYKQARGPVQDKIDTECQKLIKAYKCLEMENCEIMRDDYQAYRFWNT